MSEKIEKVINEINNILNSDDPIAKLELYRYFFFVTLEGLEVDLESYDKEELILELQRLEDKEGNIKSDWLKTYDRYLGGTKYGIHDWVEKFMDYVKEIKEDE